MLNVNSPTVQAMMQNTPQGIGNMPVYFGNTPTITEQNADQTNIPYPSPKEMLMQSGQQNIYTPTSFMPRNIVGGYNPGFQAAFDGYINPYMGYGTYGGYNNYYPIDEETRQIIQMASMNGLTYQEQIIMDTDLYKKMSRLVSNNIGRTEEEAKHFESAFEPVVQNTQSQYYREPIKPMHIQIKVGDDIVSDISSEDADGYSMNYIRNSAFIDDLIRKNNIAKEEMIKRSQLIYNSASERRMDKLDILDFLNNEAGSLLMEDLDMMIKYQNITRAGKIYDRSKFTERLLNNNGYKTRYQKNAVDRFVGRYGVMPDGRPVSPGHDPAVAQSFSYDVNTGKYNVTAPNFIRDRMEAARNRFIQSIE